jgi:aflatoxin B1 aldehyde reductase
VLCRSAPLENPLTLFIPRLTKCVTFHRYGLRRVCAVRPPPAVRRTAVKRAAVRAMASSAPAPEKKPVASLLGCMTIGWKFASTDCDDDVSVALIRKFVDAGHRELDTALAYSGGETEKIIARVLGGNPELLAKVTVATKANPWPGGNMTSTAGEGGLSPRELRKQVEQSVASLSPVTIDLLYLHAPDAATPIEDTLEELVVLYKEGKFKRLGLSNFMAWEVVKIHSLCGKYGLPQPDTYQGMYNCLTRACESELVPALKACNIRFVVYNPLCGGLLTGKHAGNLSEPGKSETGSGRFTNNATYQTRFWTKEYFAAVDLIVTACGDVTDEKITPTEASLRWLYSHSKLDGSKGDGVILGASSAAHLASNLAAAETAADGKKPLPKNVLDAIEKGHAMCVPVSPPYARGHSKLK